MASRHHKDSMGKVGRKPGLWRRLSLLLLVPYLAFALVPTHSMLAADAQGRMMVVLCGHDAPVEMAVAADGTLTPVSELDQHGTGDAAQPCIWSAHGQPLLGMAAAQIALPHLALLGTDLAPARGASLHDLFAVQRAARDPPAVI